MVCRRADRDAPRGLRPCTQLGVTRAEREGVSPAVLRAVLTENPDAMPPDVALVWKFTRATLAHDAEADKYREAIVQRWRQGALVSLAFWPSPRRDSIHQSSMPSVTAMPARASSWAARRCCLIAVEYRGPRTRGRAPRELRERDVESGRELRAVPSAAARSCIPHARLFARDSIAPLIRRRSRSKRSPSGSDSSTSRSPAAMLRISLEQRRKRNGNGHGALPRHSSRAQHTHQMFEPAWSGAYGRGRSRRAVLQRHDELRRLFDAEGCDVEEFHDHWTVRSENDPAAERRSRRSTSAAAACWSARYSWTSWTSSCIRSRVAPARKLFAEGAPAVTMTLGGAEAFESGVVYLNYRSKK